MGTLHFDDVCGEYDLEIGFALEFGWTPDQIAELESAFVEELSQALKARAKYQKDQSKRK